jgi:D-xylulose kinase
MTKDELFIGIDSGTQGTKVVVLARRRTCVLAEAYAPHEIIENDRGRREQDPEWWLAAAESALQSVLKASGVDGRRIKAMAVSGQQHGLVPLDGQGRVIRPAKLWCDTETLAQCQALTDRLGGSAAVIEAVGNSMAAGFTAPKLLWLKEKEPAAYQRIATILLPHDYINFWLTGRRATEWGDASGTAYFDVRNRCWSPAVLEAVAAGGRLEDRLPCILEPLEPCGTLRSSLAERWGLSRRVLVAAGGGDNMMAAIGTGNVSEGLLTASLGTSGTIFAYSGTPVVDDQGELAAFCSSSGGWLPLVCTMNVTVATEQVRRLLELDLERFNALVAEVPPGADGLLLLPYFNGERTPALPEATATLSGLTALNLTPANLCRASMEGATLGLRYGLEVLRRNGIRSHELRLVGGGAKSSTWRQIAADVFQMPVVTPAYTEAAALGAALQALWCYCNQAEGATTLEELCSRFVRLDEAGRADPDDDVAARYAQLYARYSDLDRAMRPLYGPR